MGRRGSRFPLIYAIPRARRWLTKNGHDDITLVTTGKLRTPSDFAKALALGADCGAIATAAMIAIGWQQYRTCASNTCPVGIATQKSELRERFDTQISAQRLVHFLEASEKQMMDYCQMLGHQPIRDLNIYDMITLDGEVARFSSVPHAGDYRG